MKTNLDSLFASNEKLETEGVWIEVGSEAKFRVKRFGGKNAHTIKKLQTKYLKPYARQIAKGILDPEKERSIYTKIFIESCLVNWEGIVDDKDNEIPYSHEAAYKLLSGLPDLFDYLVAESTNDESYRDDLGNS